MSDAAPEAAPKRTHWAWVVGTFFGIGHLRPGPGTWASAATMVLWYFAARQIPQGFQIPAALAAAIAVTAVGIPAATVVERESGRHDPSFVVIDEVAGQMLALVAAPLRWKSLIAGFILFRVFDIVKPPPVRRLERLPGGVGIMLDDVGAGLYALIVVQVLLRLGLL
ncbi:MAG: phosphatidylglycerophosphatase A [Acidobacteriia bacterium]|nr:phosphatidylglycerophosphatase A [Terriglobia bacterium]